MFLVAVLPMAASQRRTLKYASSGPRGEPAQATSFALAPREGSGALLEVVVRAVKISSAAASTGAATTWPW